MKIDLYCQRLSSDAQITLILLGVPPLEPRGLQSQYSGRKTRFSTSTRENISQTVSNAATVTIDHQKEIAYR